MKYLDMFIEDCKYYDLENIELKLILKNVNVKGKTILDLGTGVGRLAFPLAKHAKKVVALDKDKRLKSYFKIYRPKNLIFVNQEIDRFLKTNRKFDIILLAWPTFDYNFINLIKKIMSNKSKFIFITCDNNSDFETIVNKLGVVKKRQFTKEISNKSKFLARLSKEFKLVVNRKIKTYYNYPDSKTAFRVIKNE